VTDPSQIEDRIAAQAWEKVRAVKAGKATRLELTPDEARFILPAFHARLTSQRNTWKENAQWARQVAEIAENAGSPQLAEQMLVMAEWAERNLAEAEEAIALNDDLQHFDRESSAAN
jgi:hypothetical protein